MRAFGLLFLALMLLASPALAQAPVPAYWQGPPTPGNVACYQNSGNGTTLQDATVGPCNMTTTNNPALNNGLTINSGYTGAIDNTAGLRYLNRTLYGSETCATQMNKFFDNIQGFFAVDATCATLPAGTTVHQFIPGLFSVDDYGACCSGGVPVIAQSVAEVSNRAEFGINTLHVDSPIMGTSSSSSVAGTVLTIGGTVNGVFQVGDWIIGSGVAPGTQITSLGTGTGQAGTYNLNIASTAGPTRISDHLAGISGTILQDELDFFGLQPDTKARLLIDGYFPNGASSGANVRNGVLVGIFTGSAGHWQNSFVSVNGGSDVALQAGTTSAVTPAVASTPSQQVQFGYTDNTNGTSRYVQLNADPTNAGTTGADLILSSSYSGKANLSVATGSIKVNGKNVIDSSGNSVHTVYIARAAGTVAAASNVCIGLSGISTAAACGNSFWMFTNQSGTLSHLLLRAIATPGAGNTYTATLWVNGAATALSCTINDPNNSCSDNVDTVAITQNGSLMINLVSSASAPASLLATAISFDNPYQ